MDYLKIKKEDFMRIENEAYENRKNRYLEQAENTDKEFEKEFYLNKAENVRFESIIEELPFEYQMYNSIFPNNYINEYFAFKEKNLMMELGDKYYTIINNPDSLENDITYNFLYKFENRYLFMGIIDRIGCAHHPYCRYVFPEFMRGKSDYVPDALFIGKDSDGYKFFFIEFESIYGSISINNGEEFGDSIRKGIKQVSDWKNWVPSQWDNIIKELEKYSKPDVGIAPELKRYSSERIYYVVVVGRRKDYDNQSFRDEKLRKEKESNIHLVNYDAIFDEFLTRINSK